MQSGAGYSILQDALESLVDDPETFTVSFGVFGSSYNPDSRTAYVSNAHFLYFTLSPGGSCNKFAYDDGSAGAIAHELLGHALQHSKDPTYKQQSAAAKQARATHMENVFFSATGKARRCDTQ